MKKTNKILAVILCFCMMASFTALFASAEDATELPIYFRNITATKFKPDDPETVLQMEFKIEVDTEDEEEKAAILDGIDTVNTSAEIIFQDLPLEIINELKAFGSIPIWMSEEKRAIREEELLKEIEGQSTIAIAKPVSYENGVLTADVYAKDGTAGAKMIGIDIVEPSDVFEWNSFLYYIPAGVLVNSATGAYSQSDYSGSFGNDVNNLATREIKFSKLEMNALMTTAEIISKIVKGSSPAAIVARIALALPVLLLELPLFIARANSVYKVYGVNIYKTMFELCVKAPRIINWFIKNT